MEETIIENNFEKIKDKLKDVKNIIDVKDIIENEFAKIKDKIKDVNEVNIIKLCHNPMQFKRGIYESRYTNTVDLINIFRKNNTKYMKYRKDNINVCN